ncbi:hypothetical protein [Silicimonas sp. MF1-12-2]|uniref:hypothetical protein n=1 Tax=Silicimonas sp. MF1-12-2 TaxID=3384793 RepID=UPI0039B42231
MVKRTLPGHFNASDLQVLKVMVVHAAVIEVDGLNRDLAGTFDKACVFGAPVTGISRHHRASSLQRPDDGHHSRPEAGASIPIDANDSLNGAIDREARNISRSYGCSVKLKTVREIVFDFEH